MALIGDVVDSLALLRKAQNDLDDTIEINYKRGTRVSFKKFTYWRVEAPVLTGEVLWGNVKTVDNMVRIFLKIMVDEQFHPVDWRAAAPDKKSVLIDILEKEYDITIIG
jgi:hypothetical protein